MGQTIFIDKFFKTLLFLIVLIDKKERIFFSFFGYITFFFLTELLRLIFKYSSDHTFILNYFIESIYSPTFC